MIQSMDSRTGLPGFQSGLHYLLAVGLALIRLLVLLMPQLPYWQDGINNSTDLIGLLGG